MMFHGLDLRDFREMPWIYDDLGLIPSAEKSVDVLFLDLRFIDSAIFTEAAGKPLRGIPVQRPRQRLDDGEELEVFAVPQDELGAAIAEATRRGDVPDSRLVAWATGLGLRW